MGKRKRLTPADPATAQPAPETKGYPNGWAGLRRPPIADVAGDAATQAAFDDVAAELSSARTEGRLIEALDVDTIDETYLVRDRIAQDDSDTEALMASLRARGQQTPIEVVRLKAGRYGLISGWRRLSAMKALRAQGQGGFDKIQALIRTPKDTPDAYIAMVEENEIRANLSFYERARIAVRAAEQGAYPTARYAVKGLFANAPAAKRSKINSFVTIYSALDTVLAHPAALSEKQGLALAKALAADSALAGRIVAALGKAKPQDGAQEWATISGLMSGAPSAGSAPVAKAAPKAGQATSGGEGADGIKIAATKGRITISGAQIDAKFEAALRDWLADYQG